MNTTLIILPGDPAAVAAEKVRRARQTVGPTLTAATARKLRDDFIRNRRFDEAVRMNEAILRLTAQ